MSVLPPGGAGEMMRTGLLAYWAYEAAAAVARPMAARIFVIRSGMAVSFCAIIER
jgi:hypothetical protein